MIWFFGHELIFLHFMSNSWPKILHTILFICRKYENHLWIQGASRLQIYSLPHKAARAWFLPYKSCCIQTPTGPGRTRDCWGALASLTTPMDAGSIQSSYWKCNHSEGCYCHPKSNSSLIVNSAALGQVTGNLNPIAAGHPSRAPPPVGQDFRVGRSSLSLRVRLASESWLGRQCHRDRQTDPGGPAPRPGPALVIMMAAIRVRPGGSVPRGVRV